jgi:hypothetical protein
MVWSVAAGGQSAFQAVPTIVSLLVGVVGAAASLVGLVTGVWSPRRSNERPVVGHKIPTVRFWRPRNYNLALGLLNELIERWKNQEFDVQNRRGFVTEYDLVRWILQLALTCAANIVPQSLGKASLFRIGDIETDGDARIISVRVYSFELDGIFSAEQMIDPINATRMRDISISMQRQDGHRYPAALQCVQNGGPTLQSLRERASRFDNPERRLGLTHILAIPLRRDLSGAVRDQPVSITVDLHYAWLVGYLVDKFDLHRRTLVRRADQLAKALSTVSALHRAEYLPPPAPPAPPAPPRNDEPL